MTTMERLTDGLAGTRHRLQCLNVLVTPDMARDLLKQNAANRPFSRRIAQEYADVMGKSQWVVNGEAIIISSDNLLLDGQHRLHAVMIANMPVMMTIISGVDNESNAAFNTLNSGKRRSCSDRLAGAGEKNYGTLSGAISWLNRYFLGVTTLKAQLPLQPQRAMLLLETHPQLRDWCRLGGLMKPVGFSPAMSTFLLYAASKTSKDKAEQFAMQCIEGVGLVKTDAVYLLRKRVIDRSSIHVTRNIVILALMIKAWNSYAIGEPMGVLRWSKDQEAFPEVYGFPTF